jgi:hypothetical protein
MHVVASRSGTTDNRAHEDEEWLRSNGASQCRRTEGNWIAEATSTEDIRSGLSTRRIAGTIRHPIMVPTLPRRGEDCQLRLALQPAHVLLLVSNGGSINQRDPGTRRPQDDHHVCALQSSLSGAPALCHRSNRISQQLSPRCQLIGLARIRSSSSFKNRDLPQTCLPNLVWTQVEYNMCTSSRALVIPT